MLQKAWLADRARVGIPVGVVLAFCAISSGSPSSRAATFGKSSTSRAQRDAAMRSMPLQELRPDVQSRVLNVVSKPSIYRRLPVEIIDCDPAMYLFLIRNPEVVVNIWQLMGVTKISMGRTGPFSFAASDGMGTDSQLELLYGSNDTHLFYGTGEHHGRVLGKPLAGRCVLLLKSGFVRTAEGRVHVTNQLDLFIRIDRTALDTIAKTVHPLFGKTIDSNFTQSVRFLERMSRTSYRNPEGMVRLAGKLDKVDSKVRQQFSHVARGVRERTPHGIAHEVGHSTASTNIVKRRKASN